jgi:hypothetical protein
MRTRLLLILGLLIAPAAAQTAPACSALSSDDPQRAPLTRLCEFALTYRRTLPNFICEQHTVSTPSWNELPRILEEQVTYENGHSSYSNLRINGKPATESLGTRSVAFETHGEFGDEIIDLFTPGLVQFQFARRERVRSVEVDKFTLHIAAETNRIWTIGDGRRTIAPEFQGAVWIDPAGRPVRLELQPINLPQDFQMGSAEMRTEYEDVNLAEAGIHRLPTKAQSTGCQRATGGRVPRCLHNTLTFRGCHRFAARSRILNSPE